MTVSDTHQLRVRDREMIPRFLLRAMLGLVLATLAITTFAVATDRPPEAQPDISRIETERLVVLSGDLSGRAEVHSPDGTLIATFEAGKGGFIAGVARVIARERHLHRVELTGPVRLIRTEDGRLAIVDPSTEWRADLLGFGADNAKAFATLLP